SPIATPSTATLFPYTTLFRSDDARRIDGRGRRGRRSSGNSRGSLVKPGGIDGAASVGSGAAVRTVDLRGNFECYAPSERRGVNDRVVQILGEKQLRRIGRKGRGCRDDVNANAGIKGDVEFAGLLLVGVGRSGDGDDHVGELGLIGKNLRSSKSSRGSDSGAGVLNVGESADGGIAAGGFGTMAGR